MLTLLEVNYVKLSSYMHQIILINSNIINVMNIKPQPNIEIMHNFITVSIDIIYLHIYQVTIYLYTYIYCVGLKLIEL